MNNARKRNPAEALKTAKNRAESHLSAVGCVMGGFVMLTSVDHSTKQTLRSTKPAFLVWLLELPFEYEILVFHKVSAHHHFQVRRAGKEFRDALK